MQYTNDWKGVLPTDGSAPPAPPATNNKYWYIAPTRWYEKLQPYRVYNPASSQRGRTAMNCPLLQTHIGGMGVSGPNSDYAVTAMMGGLTEQNLSPPGQIRIRVPKVGRLKATTAWMMDSGAYFTGSPRVVNNNCVVGPHRDRITLYPEGAYGWSWDMPWMWAADRGDGVYGSGPFRGQGHGGRQNNFANVLFGDGHVDQVTAKWVRSLSGSIQVNNDGGPHNAWTGKPKDE
jgi:prepilin-type processing-associated H-X9-DG protein